MKKIRITVSVGPFGSDSRSSRWSSYIGTETGGPDIYGKGTPKTVGSFSHLHRTEQEAIDHVAKKVGFIIREHAEGL